MFFLKQVFGRFPVATRSPEGAGAFPDSMDHGRLTYHPPAISRARSLENESATPANCVAPTRSTTDRTTAPCARRRIVREGRRGTDLGLGSRRAAFGPQVSTIDAETETATTRSDQIGNRPRNWEATRSRTIHMACVLPFSWHSRLHLIKANRFRSRSCRAAPSKRGPLETPKLRSSPFLCRSAADFRRAYCSMTSSSKVPGSTAPRFPAAAGPSFAATTYTL